MTVLSWKMCLLWMLALSPLSLALLPRGVSLPSKSMTAPLTSNSIQRNGKGPRYNATQLSMTEPQTAIHAQERKRWGIDNKGDPDEYWFDSRIHTLGNCGFMGAFHAAMAPLSTRVIDILAYNGINLREKVAEELYSRVGKGKARVVDLCCGVGTSTRALCEAFSDAEAVIGLDTSREMIEMATFLNNHLAFFKPFFASTRRKVATGYTVLQEQGHRVKQSLNKAGASAATTLNVKQQHINGDQTATTATSGATTFLCANAEDTKLASNSFDLVTIMYAFHEAPRKGRARILAEARRLLHPGGTLAVVDISPDFKPPHSMLLGEPYVLEYQRNIDSQLVNCNGFSRPEYKLIVPGQVGMWLMKRTAISV